MPVLPFFQGEGQLPVFFIAQVRVQGQRFAWNGHFKTYHWSPLALPAEVKKEKINSPFLKGGRGGFG
jgi:hypothetical protein